MTITECPNVFGLISGRDVMYSKKGILAALTIAFCLTLCPFSNAYASPDVVNNAPGFIESAANEAGISSGDFVSTVAMIGTVATGASFGTIDGLKLGQGLEDSLNNLIEAADYPDYSTLSAEQQQSWGTKENYDAAKFNSLMNAFGLGDARDGWYASGGGNFEWTDDWKQRLQIIGNIGSNWANGAGNTVQSVLSSLDGQNYQTVFQTYTGLSESTFTEVNITDENWPSDLPRTFNVGKSNQVYINVNNRNYYYYTASTEVYWIITAWTGSQGGFYLTGFAENGFSYGSSTSGTPPTELTRTASTKTYSGNTYYDFETGIQVFYLTSISTTPPYTQVSNQTTASNLCRMNGYVLFDYNPVIEDDKIEGYPEDVTTPDNEATVIYFPLVGLKPDTTWGDLATSNSSPDLDLDGIIELLQQFKFYATGQLKVHDEGIYHSLTDISLQLETIISKMGLNNNSGSQIQQFDWGPFQTKSELLGEELENLAPFGAIFLVSNLVETVAEIAVISEPVIEIPFNFFDGHEEHITIDLAWIDDGRAVINVFVILSLMLSLAAVSMRFIEIEVG